jgi:hypothetical protein
VSFPVSLLGSNLKNLKIITEGTNLICQLVVLSDNPIFLYNNELFRRNDHNNVFQMLKKLNDFSNFDYNWNGLNMLNSSLSENGTHFLAKFQGLKIKDLNNFSTLYFINISANNSVPNLKTVAELKLLNYSLGNTFLLSNKLFIDQNYKSNSNLNFFNKIFLNVDKNLNFYRHLPSNIFYENEGTFLNTEGFFKRTVKIISHTRIGNSLQVLRKLLKNLKKNLVSLNKKNNALIFFNTNRLINFKNFIHFQFYATQKLSNLNFYLTIKTNPIFFTKTFLKFKISSKKHLNTKIKYWLDDFFTNGKDEYSQESLIITNCSKLLRLESSNFF